jgi:xyloglucan:xyloglucosyl transferase
MAPLLYLALLFMISSTSSNAQPSPGYYPSLGINPISFGQGFRNLWGPQHQRQEQGTLTIWLDSSSGIMLLCSHVFVGYVLSQIKILLI